MPRSGGAKQKWQPEEEQALRAGVARHGVGKWRLIQKDQEFADILISRSNVDLKDKWRNLNMESGAARGERRRARSPETSDSQDARKKRKRRVSRVSLEQPDTDTEAEPASGLLALGRAANRGRSRRQRRGSSLPDEDDDEEFDPGEEADEPEETEPVMPRMEDLVRAALVALHEPGGSAVEAILQWLEVRYGYAHPFRKQIRGTLREMVEQGRLQRTPGPPTLYSIGGTVGRLAGSLDASAWQRHQEGPTSSDPKTERQAAEAAAAAIREAEEAAEHASRVEQQAEGRGRRSRLPSPSQQQAQAAYADLDFKLPLSAPSNLYRPSPAAQAAQGLHAGLPPAGTGLQGPYGTLPHTFGLPAHQQLMHNSLPPSLSLGLHGLAPLPHGFGSLQGLSSLLNPNEPQPQQHHHMPPFHHLQPQQHPQHQHPQQHLQPLHHLHQQQQHPHHLQQQHPQPHHQHLSDLLPGWPPQPGRAESREHHAPHSSPGLAGLGPGSREASEGWGSRPPTRPISPLDVLAVVAQQQT